MKTITCPKCFSVHSIEQLAYGCANSNCPREYVPTTVAGKENPTCEACGRTMTLRFCPDCGFLLDTSAKGAENLPISMVGSQHSGKSNYLSVLINEVRQSMGKVYDCSLYPIGGDDTILQYRKYYYNPLYEKNRCIESTVQEEINPMIYSLIFNKESTGKLCNLTFYDACGEHFSNERRMADYTRSIYNSRGILFFVDPSQIPLLREKMLHDGKEVSEEDFDALLSRTIKLIREGLGMTSLNTKIDIPIAICVTKLDTFKNQLDSSSYFNYSSRQMNYDAFDLIDYECTNLETQAILESWGGLELINQVKSQFSHSGFFMFSSLGTQPDKDNHIKHIVPYRVCDPFLWLLAKNKIIHAKRHTIKNK